MVLIALDDLSGPSKVAILKLCIGNIGFVVFGFLAISFGAYYSEEYHIAKFVSGHILGSGPDDVKGLVDSNSSQIILSICIILIAAGVGIVIVSMVGFCGAVQRNSHCVLGYVVFLIILILAESTALALLGAFRARVDDDISQYVKAEILAENYKFGTGEHSGVTIAFDVIQMESECCGLIGSSDYKNSFKNWKSQYGNKTIPLPPFCCKFKDNKRLKWNEVLDIESIQNLTFTRLKDEFKAFWLHEDCLDSPFPSYKKAWTNQGCYKRFQEKIFDSLFRTLIGITIGIVVFEVLCLLSSCLLLCDVNVVKKVEEKREEQEIALETEKNTILAGMQATGSLAAFAMTGGAPAYPLKAGPSGMMLGNPSRMMSTSQVGYSPSVMGHYRPAYDSPSVMSHYRPGYY